MNKSCTEAPHALLPSRTHCSGLGHFVNHAIRSTRANNSNGGHAVSTAVLVHKTIYIAQSPCQTLQRTLPPRAIFVTYSFPASATTANSSESSACSLGLVTAHSRGSSCSVLAHLAGWRPLGVLEFDIRSETPAVQLKIDIAQHADTEDSHSHGPRAGPTSLMQLIRLLQYLLELVVVSADQVVLVVCRQGGQTHHSVLRRG
jgi:hypothetical protein